MDTVTSQDVESHDARSSGRMKRARWAISIAGALTALVVVLQYAVGVPPADGNELLAWMDANATGLILLDEALVFAGLALAAAAIMARNVVAAPLRERLWPAVGLAQLVTVLMFVTSLAGGRFVYPVHDIEVEDADSARLVASLFYGGMHMVYLALGALAIAVVVAGWRHSAGGVRAAGVVAAIAAIAASYPEILGRAGTLLAGLVVVGWLLVLAAALPAADRPLTPATRESTRVA